MSIYILPQNILNKLPNELWYMIQKTIDDDKRKKNFHKRIEELEKLVGVISIINFADESSFLGLRRKNGMLVYKCDTHIDIVKDIDYDSISFIRIKTHY